MPDIFASIAANYTHAEREKLIYPSPEPDNGRELTLLPNDGAPRPVYKKMSTKAELDACINTLKEKYAPFFKRKSSDRPYRDETELTEFLFREASENDFKDFPSVLSGSGEWKKVRVPHYDGPVGSKTVFYRTDFTFKKTPDGKAVFVYFQCADYIARVFINGAFAGEHEGFFGSFSFNITDFVHEGKNTLFVQLINDFKYGGEGSQENENIICEGDKLYAATGMGYDDPERGWHHCPAGMGLCGKVFIKTVPDTFVKDVFVRPLPDSSEAEIVSSVFRCSCIPENDISLSYSIYGENFDGSEKEFFYEHPFTYANEARGDIITENDVLSPDAKKDKIQLKFCKGENLIKLRLKLDGFRLWTPDKPYLYRVKVTLSVKGEKRDLSYAVFGMRSFYIDEKEKPAGMMYLNGESIRLRGANTMGYEQQDVLRGDKDMLLWDMLAAKACNMNFLRLTQRPVQSEIYELCDRIGLMIQTDLPLFTVIRRTKFSEVIRQAEEMEKLIFNHPCCILSTYINEPMANGGNRPHRHFTRPEQDALLSACDSAVRIINPDRAIKHVDGDYDPPDIGLPDNHSYSGWYNGHGIDMGELQRGYWLGIKDGWYCGCGEFGAEGLDSVSLMRRRYPAEWLPRTENEEKSWSPSQIKNAQSGNMHFFFYDTQDTLDGWVEESRRWQARSDRMMTEALRRNQKIVTFALHLFIDAWPSGWMKTVIDCERNPKPAFYEYRDALSPVLCSLRAERSSYFSGEKAGVSAFICNDTHSVSKDSLLSFELISPDGNAVLSCDTSPLYGENGSFLQGKAVFTVPEVANRTEYILRMRLSDKEGNAVHYTDIKINAFPRFDEKPGDAVCVDASSGKIDFAELEKKAADGATVIINGLPEGEYNVCGKQIKVKKCGMRPLHFVSRKTGHPLTEGFEKDDFSFWYDEKKDMITPLIYRTFTCDGLIPVLTSGNCISGSAWGKPLTKVYAAAELDYGKGAVIINEVDFSSHMINPQAKIFYTHMTKYRR